MPSKRRVKYLAREAYRLWITRGIRARGFHCHDTHYSFGYDGVVVRMNIHGQFI